MGLIDDNKKLENIINMLLPKHIIDNNQNLVNIIKVYLRYRDNYLSNLITNITKNNDVNTVYDNMLDDYLYQNFNSMIDLDKFGLSDDNKKLYLSLAKKILSLKGNKKSFEFLFKSLTNFEIAKNDGNISIDNISINYYEDESWWDADNANFYDSSIYHNGVYKYNALFNKPFTYRFELNSDKNTLKPIIEAIHPSGFNYEFLSKLKSEDKQSFAEELGLSVTYFFFYDNKYIYDGSISHSTSEIITYGA